MPSVFQQRSVALQTSIHVVQTIRQIADKIDIENAVDGKWLAGLKLSRAGDFQAAEDSAECTTAIAEAANV